MPESARTLRRGTSGYTQSRKGFILSWMAADVTCGFVEGVSAISSTVYCSVASLRAMRCAQIADHTYICANFWIAAQRCAGLRAMFPPLRASLLASQPGREHVIYSEGEFNHFVSDYDPAWEESFMPGKTTRDCATPQQQPSAAVPKL
jgi:hypothetical protein